MTSPAPHLYTSAIEAVLAGALDTGNPVLSSELYLSRPFTLTDDGFFWGRYAVHATRGPHPQAYRAAKAEEIAAVFCALLVEQQPGAVAGFKNECMALTAYRQGAAPLRTALSAVFDAAKPLHRIQEVAFDYSGFQGGVHNASVRDKDGVEYSVWFDEQLVLTHVSELRVGARQVWPESQA